MTNRPVLQSQSAPPGFLPSNRSQSDAVIGGAVTLFVVLVALNLISRWMIRICRPNELLVVTGSRSNQGQEGVKGYRVVANGGWTFVKPIQETARRMDVTLLPVLVEVNNAYSKGGTPLNIQAIANVKVSSDPAVRNNAIERFLGRDPAEIVQVAKENLEGNLRSVLAQLTPEQVNEDRLRFAEQIADEVGQDLRRLGLQLDTLKIQSVSDDVDYLNSISRRRVAQIVRDAEIAEQEAARVAAEQEAARVVAEQERQRAAAMQRQQEAQAAERARLQAQREQAEAESRARAEAERREQEAAERRERERLAAIAAAEAERQQKLDRISQLEAQIAAAETRTESDEERSLVLQQAIVAAEDLLEALSAEQAKYENTDSAGNTAEPLAKDLIADLQARKDSLVEQARAQ